MLALRHRRVLQVLLVDHGLQGGVYLEGERLAVLLHSAGGGQLCRGGFCTQQVAQVQRVAVDRCTVDLQRWWRHAVGWGQQHVGHVQLERVGQVAVGWCRQVQLGHLLGAQLERLVPRSGVQVEHHRLGARWAVELDEPRLVAMHRLLLVDHRFSSGLALRKNLAKEAFK